MITYGKFEKLYESLTNLTELYGQLVEIAKSFENVLGAEDVATTNIYDAIAKINELILRYTPSAGELDLVQDETQGQPLQDVQSQIQLQPEPFGDDLQGQVQPQAQVQNQGQPLQAQIQDELGGQVQPQTQEQQIQDM